MSSTHVLCSSTSIQGSGSLQIHTPSYPSPVYASQCLCLLSFPPRALNLTLHASLTQPPGHKSVPATVVESSDSQQSLHKFKLSAEAPATSTSPSTTSTSHRGVRRAVIRRPRSPSDPAPPPSPCPVRMDVQYSDQTYTVCAGHSSPTELVTNLTETDHSLHLMLHNPNLELVTAHVDIQVYPEGPIQVNCTDLGSNVWVAASDRISRREYMRGDIIAGSILGVLMLLLLLLAFTRQLTMRMNKVRQVKGARYMKNEGQQRNRTGSRQTTHISRRFQGSAEGRNQRPRDMRRSNQPTTSQYQNFGYLTNSELSSSYLDQLYSNQQTISSILLNTTGTESNPGNYRHTPQWEYSDNVCSRASSSVLQKYNGGEYSNTSNVPSWYSNGNTQHRDIYNLDVPEWNSTGNTTHTDRYDPNRRILDTTSPNSQSQPNPAGQGCLWRIPITFSTALSVHSVCASANNSSSVTRQLLQPESRENSCKQNHQVTDLDYRDDRHKSNSGMMKTRSIDKMNIPRDKTKNRVTIREVSREVGDEISNTVTKKNKAEAGFHLSKSCDSSKQAEVDFHLSKSSDRSRETEVNEVDSNQGSVHYTSTDGHLQRPRRTKRKDLDSTIEAGIHLKSSEHLSDLPIVNNVTNPPSDTSKKKPCYSSQPSSSKSSNLMTDQLGASDHNITTSNQSGLPNGKSKRARQISGPLKEESKIASQSEQNLYHKPRTLDQSQPVNDKSHKTSLIDISNGISKAIDQLKHSTDKLDRTDCDILLVDYRSSPQPRRNLNPLMITSDRNHNTAQRTDATTLASSADKLNGQKSTVSNSSQMIHSNILHESEV